MAPPNRPPPPDPDQDEAASPEEFQEVVVEPKALERPTSEPADDPASEFDKHRATTKKNKEIAESLAAREAALTNEEIPALKDGKEEDVTEEFALDIPTRRVRSDDKSR